MIDDVNGTGTDVVLLARECCEIARRGIETDLPSGALGNLLRDRRPEAMPPVLLLLRRPDSIVTRNAVGIFPMQRDQFVCLTNDAFAI